MVSNTRFEIFWVLYSKVVLRWLDWFWTFGHRLISCLATPLFLSFELTRIVETNFFGCTLSSLGYMENVLVLVGIFDYWGFSDIRTFRKCGFWYLQRHLRILLSKIKGTTKFHLPSLHGSFPLPSHLLYRARPWPISIRLRIRLKSSKHVFPDIRCFLPVWQDFVLVQKIRLHGVEVVEEFPFEFWILFKLLHSFDDLGLIGLIVFYDVFDGVGVINYCYFVLDVIIFEKLVTHKLPTGLTKVIKECDGFLSNNVPHVWWHFLFSFHSQLVVIYSSQLLVGHVVLLRQKLLISEFLSFWELFEACLQDFSPIVKNTFYCKYVLWKVLEIIQKRIVEIQIKVLVALKGFFCHWCLGSILFILQQRFKLILFSYDSWFEFVVVALPSGFTFHQIAFPWTWVHLLQVKIYLPLFLILLLIWQFDVHLSIFE